jgi:hypothetical protein
LYSFTHCNDRVGRGTTSCVLHHHGPGIVPPPLVVVVSHVCSKEKNR